MTSNIKVERYQKSLDLCLESETAAISRVRKVLHFVCYTMRVTLMSYEVFLTRFFYIIFLQCVCLFVCLVGWLVGRLVDWFLYVYTYVCCMHA